VKHLPLFFDLAGRRVIVADKAGGRSSCRVGALGGRRRFPARDRLHADLKGAAAVFVATGNLDSDTDARRAAKAAGVPVNVADRPALSDFILPAIIDRGEVVVAVSTGGASPSLATLLRARIEVCCPNASARSLVWRRPSAPRPRL